MTTWKDYDTYNNSASFPSSMHIISSKVLFHDMKSGCLSLPLHRCLCVDIYFIPKPLNPRYPQYWLDINSIELTPWSDVTATVSNIETIYFERYDLSENVRWYWHKKPDFVGLNKTDSVFVPFWYVTPVYLPSLLSLQFEMICKF